MSYGTIILIIICASTVTGTLAWAVRRSVPVDTLRRHHEMGAAVFLQLGVVFAVLLAFVFNESWGEYNAAADAINQECGSLHGAAMLANSLPEPGRGQVEQAMRTYVASVIAVEWPAMAARRKSEAVSLLFQSLLTSAARLPARSGEAESLKPQIIELLAAAHQQRETRLFQTTQGIPKLIWLLLAVFSLVLTSFLFAFGIDYVASQVGFVAIFTAMLCFTLVTVRLLDFPFEGPLRLSSVDFQSTLAKIDLIIAGDQAGL